MTGADERFMAHALTIGARGLGRVWPNPAVGCVIVKDDRIIGRGWTQPGGVPHGETVALAQAGAAARGATVYVTLEPCSHHGRTAPCCDALIAAGVARVVVATGDPNPAVNGAGIAGLKAAGVSVTEGVLGPAAERTHAGFFSQITAGRPTLTLKLAASLDGRIATHTGESQWITGPGARREVHAMRARHDAVLVGGGTARADDPSLTVRDLVFDHQPVRIVASAKLDLPLQSKLAATAKDIPVWILHGPAADASLKDAWTGIGATLIEVPVGRDLRLDMAAALQALGAAGLTRVFCEGGGALAASLLRAGQVDALVSFGAGMVIGGDGHAMVGEIGARGLAQAPRFVLVETRAVSGDTLSRWRRI